MHHILSNPIEILQTRINLKSLKNDTRKRRGIKIKIVKNIIPSSEEFLSQFIKFGIVGILNGIVGFGSMLLLFNVFLVNYLLSNIIGYCLGLINSFVLNKTFTFQSRKSIKKELPHFVIIFIISYSANLIALIILVNEFYFNTNVAYIFGMMIYSITNFMGNKYLTFAIKEN